MSKDGNLPPRPGEQQNSVQYDDGKILVQVGTENVELEIADALAMASQIICICEVHERVRREQADSGNKS